MFLLQLTLKIKCLLEYTFAKWTIDYMKWAYNIKVCVTKIKIMAKIMTEKKCSTSGPPRITGSGFFAFVWGFY